MKKLLFVLLLVFGCDPTYPGISPTEEEQKLLDDSVLCWEEEFEPISDFCTNRYKSLRILVTSGQDFFDMCLKCDPGMCTDGISPECPYGCASGCLPYVDVDIITINEAVAEEKRPRLMRHELYHLLSQCVFGDYDYYHTNERVWFLVKTCGE